MYSYILTVACAFIPINIYRHDKVGYHLYCCDNYKKRKMKENLYKYYKYSTISISIVLKIIFFFYYYQTQNKF